MDNFLLLFIIILLYVLFLFIIQNLGFKSKKRGSNSNNCCPDCSSSLNRIKRIYKDGIIYYLTLGMFNWNRYICNKCGWEGLRWKKH
jgi:predicted RNA-binding Zn-ribbon protein involved in translation (DUF1610 family)